MIIDTHHHPRDRRHRSSDARPDCREGGGIDCVDNGSTLGDNGPAYGFGLHARGRYPGRDFDDVESQLSSEWAGRGASILSWAWARHAARDAWDHISRSRSLCA